MIKARLLVFYRETKINVVLRGRARAARLLVTQDLATASGEEA